MTVAEKVIEVRGSEVRLLAGGEGEGVPVLYLHGEDDVGASSPFFEALSTTFAVVRPDLPGFNGSAGRAGGARVHDLAFFTLDVMDALGLDRVSVFGTGLGGWLAADLATIEPRRVERLVLVAAFGLRPSEGHGGDIFLLDPVEEARILYHEPSAVDVAVEAARRLAEDPDAHARYLRNRAALAHLAWNPYLHDPRLEERLHRVAASTLVVWGEEDRVVPPLTARRYGAAIASARVAVIPGTGHLPHLEAPGAVLSEVVPFLATGRPGVS